jgi:hypothetical protein
MGDSIINRGRLNILKSIALQVKFPSPIKEVRMPIVEQNHYS